MDSDEYSPDLRTREYTGKLKRAYVAWNHMQARCYNPRNPDFHNYGGRGIVVCPKWYTFIGFLEDMGYPPEGLSLDRKDSNGNYEKDNCRWADKWTQGRNRAKVHLSEADVRKIRHRVFWNNERHSDVARDYGVSRSTITAVTNRRNWSNVK